MQLLAKITIVFVVALIGEAALRRHRAAIQHLPLAAAFLMMPLLALAAMLGPVVPIEVPLGAGGPQPGILAAPGFPSWFVSLWGLGCAAASVPAIVGLFAAGRLRRFGRAWPEAQTLARLLAAQNGVTRPVDIVCGDGMCGPMTSGVRRPLIVFPTCAHDWSDADLRRALRHELEHIRRRDWLLQVLGRTVVAVCWFHPLVWIVWRRLRAAAERACDDAAVCGENATGYAEQLVSLAERWSREQLLTPVAMARGDLASRVRAVLDSRQVRGRATWRHTMAAGMAAIAALVLIGPIDAVSPIGFELPQAPALLAPDRPVIVPPPVTPVRFQVHGPPALVRRRVISVDRMKPPDLRSLSPHMRLLIALRANEVGRPFARPVMPRDVIRWAGF